MLSTFAKTLRAWLLIEIGAAYLLVGLFSLYNAFIEWQLGGIGMGMFMIYGLLYVLLSYLFFTKQRWLLYLVGLNLAANVCVWGYRAITASGFSSVAIVIILLYGLLTWFLWSIRESLGNSTAGQWAAAGAFILWTIVLYVAITTL